MLTLIALSVACARTEKLAMFNPPEVAPFDAGSDGDGGMTVDAACPTESNDLFNNAHSPYLGGGESVDLEVVTFSNFACSHCANFADSVKEIWNRRTDINNRVRIYFHHYPFDYEFNWEQHQAARAAANQSMEAFWAMHDYIYDGLIAGEYYNRGDLTEFADSTLGLDMIQFEQDLESEETISFLLWDREQCLATGASGTPSVFVCGQKIAWTQLEMVIDMFLKD